MSLLSRLSLAVTMEDQNNSAAAAKDTQSSASVTLAKSVRDSLPKLRTVAPAIACYCDRDDVCRVAGVAVGARACCVVKGVAYLFQFIKTEVSFNQLPHWKAQGSGSESFRFDGRVSGSEQRNETWAEWNLHFKGTFCSDQNVSEDGIWKPRLQFRVLQ